MCNIFRYIFLLDFYNLFILFVYFSSFVKLSGQGFISSLWNVATPIYYWNRGTDFIPLNTKHTHINRTILTFQQFEFKCFIHEQHFLLSVCNLNATSELTIYALNLAVFRHCICICIWQYDLGATILWKNFGIRSMYISRHCSSMLKYRHIESRYAHKNENDFIWRINWIAWGIPTFCCIAYKIWLMFNGNCWET